MAGAGSEIGQPVPVVAAPLPSLAPAGVPEQAAMAAAAAAATITTTTAPYPVDTQRPLPTPFLTKTYQLVEDTAIDDVISWNEDGSTFVVWRPAEFARDLLPQYFKHNNFSSFVRQLNTYGFKKIVPDRWEFANDCFRRGEKQLLCDIHRRKVHPPVPAIPMAIPVAIPASGVASPTNSADEQVLSRTSSPVAAPSTSGRVSGGASPELVEENNWLRKENERLNQELSQMKSLCNNIVVLMSKHAGQLQLQHQQSDGGGCPQAAAAEKPTPPPSPLELMPLIRCSSESESVDGWVKMEEGRRSPSPRLFGVPIGLKRGRAVEGEDASAATASDEQLAEVKPEPVDLIAVDSPPDQKVDHHYRWRLYRPRRANHRVCN